MKKCIYNYFALLLLPFLLITNSNCMFDAPIQDPAARLAAQEYNRTVALNRFPKDVSHYMFQIILDPNNAIEDNIKTSLSLSAVCTQLNDLQYLGTLLERHDSDTKNKTLKNMLSTMNDPKYFMQRRALLLLLHAKTDPNCTVTMSCSLLERAVSHNDISMLLLLSRYKADFNIKGFFDEPLFFGITHIKIAKIFESHEVDFNAPSESNPNILWQIYLCDYHFDNIKALVEFYLSKNVNPFVINERGECLLHEIAGTTYVEKISDSYKEAVELLLMKISHLINTVDEKKKTPLDTALENILCPNSIIKLFEKYGAKKATELVQ